jgi:NitT/TauT family transport system substrate-binding protein
MDALPFIVAEQQGYFDAAGVAVELVHTGSAADRDQLLQSGRVDGVVTDLVALAFYNRTAPQVAAVRMSMRPMPGHPQFRILAAPGSSITRPAELKGVPVAVSEGTIIEYVTRKALAAAGLPPRDIQVVAIPGIPTRMTMLESGNVKAACLPEPLASLAEAKGAVPLVDAIDHRPFSCSVIAFSKQTLTARRSAVQALLGALDRAVDDINADKKTWQKTASENQLIPAPLKDSFELMDYPQAGLPPPEMVDAVIEWLTSTGKLAGYTPTYDDMVDRNAGKNTAKKTAPKP